MKIRNKIINKMPGQTKNIIPKVIKSTPKKALNKGFKFAESLGEKGFDRFTDFIKAENPEEQILQQIAIFNNQEQKELLKKDFKIYKKYQTHFNNKNTEHLMTSCLKFDLKGPMIDDLLMKVDKNTMAFSIEGRVPFLDHRIIELASTIPHNLKLKGLTKDKYILRKSVKNLLPKQTRQRKKAHFFVPIDNWFKNELATLKEDLLSKHYIKDQNIFSYRYIDKINKNFTSSKLFYSRQLWALITFQIWYKQFIEKTSVKL